jgi:pyrroloquinoline quinone (PQQ) biosynthesis protein C
MGSMQLFEFKNNKIIPKYQNIPHDYRKLHKQQCEKTKLLSYAKLIFFFSKAKDVF